MINIELVDKLVSDSRLNECINCDRLFKATHTCKECGCFMKIKTKINTSKCPLGKW
jgi:rRNA maturation endonuclease Nob1